MKIFITGASGFIGSQIVKRLGSEHQFFAMARSEKSAQKVKEIGAIPVLCALGKVSLEHLGDCEVIIHSAAFVKEWGTRAEFWETTVEGTKQLLEIAKQSQVKRFIHISTEALLFTGQDLENIDETYPYPEKSKFLYSESKLAAEKLALSFNQPEQFEVSVIRPRLVWGPGDLTILPNLVEKIKSNNFMWVNQGSNLTSSTHIYNLVEGIRLLLENWKAGEVYFIIDKETSTYREFLTQYVKTQNIDPGKKNISKPLVRTAAGLVEFIWKTFGLKSDPPITRFTAYMLSSTFVLSHEKATRDLGYQPIISVKEGMKEMEDIKIEV